MDILMGGHGMMSMEQLPLIVPTRIPINGQSSTLMFIGWSPMM